MSAVAAVKRFRLRESRFLYSHSRRFGPLPEPTAPPTSFFRFPNPFLSWRNPKTGKWSEIRYSLRRQAELVKKAKISGTLHLLPPGLKTPKYIPEPVSALETLAPDAKTSGMSEERAVKKKTLGDQLWRAPIDWVAGSIREGSEAAKEKKMFEKPGAELGTRLYAGKKRMFKGHKWERVKAHRERRQSILMRDMAKRVFNYKNYYKKRRPNPLKPPRTTKAPKLPF